MILVAIMVVTARSLVVTPVVSVRFFIKGIVTGYERLWKFPTQRGITGSPIAPYLGLVAKRCIVLVLHIDWPHVKSSQRLENKPIHLWTKKYRGMVPRPHAHA